MLKLNLEKEPYWLELPAQVRLKVKPLTTAVMNVAQHQSIQEMLTLQQERTAQMEAGANARDLPNLEDNTVRASYIKLVLAKALGRLAIIEWEGVMLPDGKTLAEITDESIAQLMDIWFIADAFYSKYTAALDRLESEGNASGPVANGTSAAGPDTAGTA